MIFDTHCHDNLEPLFHTWPNAWGMARKNGVNQAAVIGTSVGTSLRAVNLSQLDPRLHPVIGIHPSEWQELVELHPGWTKSQFEAYADAEFRSLKRMFNKFRIYGVGETGLDYYRLPKKTSHIAKVKKLQTASFIWQLQAASEQQLPIIIHVRDVDETAYWETLSLLKAHYRSPRPFILHCVSGPVEYVKEALEMGAYLGIAGNVTYKNADHIRSLIKLAPPDRLLLETDAPYLPPVPHRGEDCEPWMIHITAEYVAEELGLDLDQIYQNSLQIFT
jgi:TatD DNase family protein